LAGARGPEDDRQLARPDLQRGAVDDRDPVVPLDQPVQDQPDHGGGSPAIRSTLRYLCRAQAVHSALSQARNLSSATSRPLTAPTRSFNKSPSMIRAGRLQLASSQALWSAAGATCSARVSTIGLGSSPRLCCSATSTSTDAGGQGGACVIQLSHR